MPFLRLFCFKLIIVNAAFAQVENYVYTFARKPVVYDIEHVFIVSHGVARILC